jgi:hypothetical protein
VGRARRAASYLHWGNGGFDLVGDHLVGMRPGNVMAKAFSAGFHVRPIVLCPGWV